MKLSFAMVAAAFQRGGGAQLGRMTNLIRCVIISGSRHSVSVGYYSCRGIPRWFPARYFIWGRLVKATGVQQG